MEGDVEGPVKVVFDGPVASHGVGEAFGREGARGDVGSPLDFDLVCPLDPALDHGDSGDAGEPGCARIGALGCDPIDGVRDRMGAEFDPAVILTEGLEPLDLAGRCGVEIAFDVGMQRRLVVLDGQKVVGLGIADRLGDGRIGIPWRRSRPVRR
jgi:hypothetical protein